MKNKKLQKWLLTLATVAVAVICAGAVYTIAQATSITITEIDYEKLTMTIKANEGDSRIFFATSKNASTWDEIPEEVGNRWNGNHGYFLGKYFQRLSIVYQRR